MKSKILLLLVVLTALGSLNPIVAQENDDMYFSSRDREKLYASSYTNQSTSLNDDDDEYATNHNFYSSTLQSTTAGSPTVQSPGNVEDANNQYFIKDYSITNKTDNEVKTYSGINSNNGFHSGVNVIFSFGSFYGGSPYGYGYYNPYNDPFSPYYDPFYRYRSPSYYASYRYNPWRYNNYYYGNSYNNGYYNSSNFCATTSYSNNVRNEVRYRNGRKIISGSRSSRSAVRSTGNSDRGRAVINKGKVSTNGRNSGNRSGNTYRKYNGSNRSSTRTQSNSNRSSSYTKTNSGSGKSNVNRSTGSSSRSNSNYSRSGSRSSGSTRSKPSSGGSRSSGSRSKRGN